MEVVSKKVSKFEWNRYLANLGSKSGTWLNLKGNYFWRDPVFTSIVMGGRVIIMSYCFFFGTCKDKLCRGRINTEMQESARTIPMSQSTLPISENLLRVFLRSRN